MARANHKGANVCFPMGSSKIHAVVIPLVAVMSLVGCDGKTTKQTPAEEALVAKSEVTRARVDSPVGTALQLWKAVQVGDVPSAAAFYHPKVRQTIGFGTIVGVLGQQRVSLAVLHPRIMSVQRTPLGVQVVVGARSGGSGVGIQSFLLRRDPEGWRVAYDTLLGDGLSSYVESQVQSRVAPRSSSPSPIAQRAAQQARIAYQTLFLKTLPSDAQPGPVNQ